MSFRLTIFAALLSASSIMVAQQEFFLGQTHFMQKLNPSYFGYNNLNKVGVLFNSMRLGTAERSSENKYFFCALSFDQLKFSIGFGINAFDIPTNGLNTTIADISYVYKIKLGLDTILLPSVNVGLVNASVNADNLIFEDQINQTSGFINAQTIDPLGENNLSVNYIEFAASFLIHNEDYLFGASIKNINQPNISFNNDISFKKPLLMSVMGGYEFNINRYEQGFLPRYSFLLTYASITKYGDIYRFYTSQEFQFGELSFSLNQQASLFEDFNLINSGVALGFAVENFDFGLLYNFPLFTQNTSFSSSMFEFTVVFNFSKFRRNRKGLFKRLQVDNYF